MRAWEAKGYPMYHAAEGGKTGGKALYALHCATCHQLDGQGIKGNYPPLKGNAIATMRDPRALILVVLNGLTPGSTPGQPAPAAMPPYDTTLSNRELAEIATYVRSNWGNAAPAVKPEDVKALRVKR
jgi:mono/diheme cytochrome c family protein